MSDSDTSCALLNNLSKIHAERHLFWQHWSTILVGFSFTDLFVVDHPHVFGYYMVKRKYTELSVLCSTAS